MFNSKLVLAAIVLVIIGAINWGLIAVNGTNLVTMATSATGLQLSTQAMINRAIYALVGVSGLIVAWHTWQSSRRM
jgi:uncharacterized membrane protein YuzA (DUF378 family)